MKPIKTISVFIIASFLFTQNILAQVSAETEKEVMKFSLAQAQEYAVQNATKAQNANLDAAISKKRTLEIITEGLPQISGSFNYQYNYELQTNIIPAGTFPGMTKDEPVQFGTPYNSSAVLEINQLIVDGRYFLGLKANKAIIAISKDQIEMTAIDLKNQVAKSYYSALVARESKSIIEKNLSVVKTLLNETEAFYKAGFVEELDVDRLKLSQSNLESQLSNTEMQILVSESVLKYQIGLPYEQPIELTDKLEATLIADDISAEVSSFDPKSRVEYRMQQTQIQLRGYDAKRFALGYMPGIYGFFNYGYNTFKRINANVFDNQWFPYGSAGLSVQVPIFDSFKKGAQYQQKKLEKQQLENNLKDFENSSKVQVNNAHLNYQTAIQNFKNQKDNYDLADKIYKRVQVKYKNGVGSSFELADADSQLSQAQGNYIQAIYNVLTAKTDLEKALGKIK
jgi:outer membrane protein TolC